MDTPQMRSLVYFLKTKRCLRTAATTMMATKKVPMMGRLSRPFPTLWLILELGVRGTVMLAVGVNDPKLGAVIVKELVMVCAQRIVNVMQASANSEVIGTCPLNRTMIMSNHGEPYAFGSSLPSG